MKRIALVLCLTLCLLLWGCGNEGTINPTAPPAQPVETTGPAGTLPPETTQPETTAPTEPEPTLPQEALTEYPQIELTDYVTFLPLSDTQAVAVTYIYNEEQEAIRVDILDLSQGVTVRSEVLEDGLYIAGQQISENKILIEDTNQGNYLVLDEKLQEVGRITVPRLFGYFSMDLTRFYYEENGRLMVWNVLEEAAVPVPGAEDIWVNYINDFDPQREIISFCAYINPFTYSGANVVFDLRKGEVLVFSELEGYQSCQGDGVLTQEYDEATGYTELYYYRYGSDRYLLAQPEDFQDPDFYVASLENSEYVLVSRYERPEVAEGIVRFGDTMEYSPELLEAFPGTLGDALAMPDGSILCSFILEEAGYELMLVRPDMFDFEPMCQLQTSDCDTMNEELMGSYQRILEGPALDPELAGVRALADEIEEEYGITILISNQCAEPAKGCEFPMTTTDQLEWMDETWYISDALHILRRTLSMYPEGFFRQMRSSFAPNGLLVLLVGGIQSDNNAIGVAYGMNMWYPIAVDIGSYDLMSTYCHEIWHATESFISDRDYEIFNNGDWETLNPAEFTYSYDTTTGYYDDTRWAYYDGWYGTESYFVDAYARVNAKEDRARLMEYIMTHEEESRWLMEAPALNEKLEFVCRGIRSAFDTTDWDNVWWERYHEDVLNQE